MDDYSKELNQMPWSQGRRLICSLRTYRGKTGLDIRIHFFESEQGKWQSTQKGIWIPIQKARQFLDLVTDAHKKLSAMGDFGGHSETAAPQNELWPDGNAVPHGNGKIDSKPNGVSDQDSEEPPEDAMNRFLGS